MGNFLPGRFQHFAGRSDFMPYPTCNLKVLGLNLSFVSVEAVLSVTFVRGIE